MCGVGVGSVSVSSQVVGMSIDCSGCDTDVPVGVYHVVPPQEEKAVLPPSIVLGSFDGRSVAFTEVASDDCDDDVSTPQLFQLHLEKYRALIGDRFKTHDDFETFMKLPIDKEHRRKLFTTLTNPRPGGTKRAQS